MNTQGGFHQPPCYSYTPVSGGQPKPYIPLMPCSISKPQTDSAGEAGEAPNLTTVGRSLIQHPTQSRAKLSVGPNLILHAQGLSSHILSMRFLHLSGLLFQCFTTLGGKTLPNIRSKFVLLQCVPFVLSLCTSEDSRDPSSSHASKLKEPPPLSQAPDLKSFWWLLYGHVFVAVGSPNPGPALQVWSCKCQIEGNHLIS